MFDFSLDQMLIWGDAKVSLVTKVSHVLTQSRIPAR